jgi:hypothetical protein
MTSASKKIRSAAGNPISLGRILAEASNEPVVASHQVRGEQ